MHHLRGCESPPSTLAASKQAGRAFELEGQHEQTGRDLLGLGSAAGRLAGRSKPRPVFAGAVVPGSLQELAIDRGLGAVEALPVG